MLFQNGVSQAAYFEKLLVERLSAKICKHVALCDTRQKIGMSVP